MNWDAIGAVAELLGALGVIATLVYLGRQIRQNTDSVSMSAEGAMSQQIADWASRVNADPELGEIWNKAADSQDELTDYEKRRWLWFIVEMMFMYEGHFQLFLKGHISPGAWDAKANLMVGLLMQNKAAAEWWEGRVAPFSPEFFEHIETRRKAADSDWKLQSTSNIQPPPDKLAESDT